MDVNTSNKRRNEILKTLICLYIQDVKPISSKFIKQKYNLPISTATIRNIMHELEEMNYIVQPHISSGRIPTDKGYRYYIDSLMEEEDLTPYQKQKLKNEYQALSKKVEDVINKTAEILSCMSYEAGINLFFNFKESLLKHIDLVNITHERTLLIVVTDSGLIRNYVIELSKPVADSKLREISNFLNINLQNIPLFKIKIELNKYLKERENLSINLAKKTLEIFDSDDIFEDEYEIYQDGINYILKKPEFKDIDKLKCILDVLEDKDAMAEILRDSFEPSLKRVKVLIGRENKYKNIQECSLVTSNYRIGDRTVGILGLLGPTRMAYSKLLPLVEYMSEVLSEILTEDILGDNEEAKYDD